MRPFGGWKEERSMRILPKLMDKDAKASLGVTETLCRLLTGKALDEISPEGFVLPMSGIRGL